MRRDDLQLKLEILLKFRHTFRHAHGFMLEKFQMKELFLELPTIASAFKPCVIIWMEGGSC